MSLHKLSAGSGYEYLTRQVAALDSTEKGRTALADYYSAKGESPGHWVGSGLVGIDGLDAGDVVRAGQMKYLFGAGCDPVTGVPLGLAYRVYSNEVVDGFNAEVARRLQTREPSVGASARESARARSEVARDCPAEVAASALSHCHSLSESDDSAARFGRSIRADPTVYRDEVVEKAQQVHNEVHSPYEREGRPGHHGTQHFATSELEFAPVSTGRSVAIPTSSSYSRDSHTVRAGHALDGFGGQDLARDASRRPIPA